MSTELDETVDDRNIMRTDLEGLRNLRWIDINRPISERALRHIFETCGALWLHSGDPLAPHAELTGGKCSNGFVDTLRVLKYSNLCEFMAEQLDRKFHDQCPDQQVDWVIGSDHASATLSFAVSLFLGSQHDFTEKGEGKTQVWKRFAIQPSEVVLQVEELITTTGTLQAVRDGIRQGNLCPVEFAPVVLTLIHRSEVYEFEGAPILYLAHFDIQTWEQSVCPLCAVGSKRLRPKQHWAELTGKQQ